MKKRVIGATVFLVIVYLSILFNKFIYLNSAFLIIGIYEMMMIAKDKKKSSYSLLYLVIFLLGIVALHKIAVFGGWYIFLLVSITMLIDTFAFLVGRKYGKTKISKISTNKSLEGLGGGILATIIIFYIFLFVFDKTFSLTIFSQLPLYISTLIIILLGIFSFYGDILESKLKRIYQVKDSGTIIYGHGGVLDRIDSWILAGIIFWIVLKIIS